MKKIKILNFPMGNTMGGLTRYALTNGEFIDNQKFQFDYAAIQQIENKEVFTCHGGRLFQLDCYPRQNFAKFSRDFNKILDENYDVIHIHTRHWSDFTIEELARQRNIPKIIVHAHVSEVILTMENGDIYEEKRRKLTEEHYAVRERLTEKVATDFWACSEEAADWLYGNRIPASRIVFMKNAINVSKFVFQRSLFEEVRKNLGIQDKFVIGQVGRFAAEKNHKFMIEVLKELLKLDTNIVLIFIGEGPTESSIKNMVKQYGLDQHVIFLGKREDVHHILQGMDMFSLPSIKEGFPISLVEAQASDLPCVVSDSVTKKANILGTIDYQPLEIQNWVSSILRIKRKNWTRRNVYQEMTDKGYNIKYQIKDLEARYAEGVL